MSGDITAVITKTVKISTVDAIETFVNTASRFKCQATLIYGDAAVDAKAMLGILSLNVKSPLQLELEVKKDTIDDRQDFIDAIHDYIINSKGNDINGNELLAC